jgi:hypothetical protein
MPNGSIWLRYLCVLIASQAWTPLNGLIVFLGEKFADFLHRAMLETGCEQPVYAWHIADFDLPGKEFTTGSRLVRL